MPTSESGSDPREIVASALAVDARSAEMIAAFARAGISCVLLKGATLKRWLYEREARSYGDVDLLVPPQWVDAAGELLGTLGYEASPYDTDASHAQCYHLARNRNQKVDLHRSFHFVGASPGTVWACIDRDAVPFPLLGAAARAPSLPARALFVALHAVASGPGGQQREDLRRALRDPAIWPAAARLARELDAVPGLTAALRAVPEGRPVADALGLPAEPPARLRLSADGAPATADGIMALIEAPTLGARVRLVARELVPPRLQMHEHVPLARRGRLGMLAAYLVRPVMVARELPGGWRAVRSLRPRSKPRSARVRSRPRHGHERDNR
jgi:hypothetical protein